MGSIKHWYWRTMSRLPADLGSLADAVADQLDGAEVALLSYGSPWLV